MALSEEELERRRAATRASLIEGLIATARSRGYVEATEAMSALLTAHGVSVPESISRSSEGMADLCERHERGQRESLAQIDTADEATLARINAQAKAFAGELRDRIAITHEWTRGE